MKQKPAKQAESKKKPVRSRRQALQEALLKFTPRQLKYRQNRMSGMSIYQAAVQAGYGRGYARGTAYRSVERMVKHGIIEELNIQGYTNEWQVGRIGFLADKATKMQSCTIKVKDEAGNLTITEDARVEVPDFHLQLNALEHIAKLKKQISAPAGQSGPTIGIDRLIIVVERNGQKEAAIDKDIIDVRQTNNPDVEADVSVGLTRQ